MFTNLVIHRIGRQVGADWPLDCSEHYLCLGKHRRVAQGLKDRAIDAGTAEKRFHMNLAAGTVEESHA